jgi:hypothetical protein
MIVVTNSSALIKMSRLLLLSFFWMSVHWIIFFSFVHCKWALPDYRVLFAYTMTRKIALISGASFISIWDLEVTITFVGRDKWCLKVKFCATNHAEVFSMLENKGRVVCIDL